LPSRIIVKTSWGEELAENLISQRGAAGTVKCLASAKAANCILGTLKYEPHAGDTTALRRAQEGVIGSGGKVVY
jgi:hypothetical protein